MFQKNPETHIVWYTSAEQETLGTGFHILTDICRLWHVWASEQVLSSSWSLSCAKGSGLDDRWPAGRQQRAHGGCGWVWVMAAKSGSLWVVRAHWGLVPSPPVSQSLPVTPFGVGR